MKIRAKITLGYALIALLVVVVGYAGFWNTNKTETSYEGMIGKAVPAINAIHNLRYHGLDLVAITAEILFLQAQGKVSGMTDLAADTTEIFLLRERALIPFSESLAQYASLVDQDHPGRRQHVARIKDLSEQLKARSAEIVAIVNQTAPAQSAVIDATHHLGEVKAEFSAAIDAALAYEMKQVTLQHHVAQDATRLAFQALVIATAVSLLVALILGEVISRSLARPIIALKDAALRLGGGDLGTRVDALSRDEVGMLARSFNDMAHALSETTVSKGYVENVIGSIADSLIVTDALDRITRVNAATVRMLGYTETELLQMPVARVAPGLAGSPRDSGMKDHEEVTYYAVDGREVPVAIAISELHAADGTHLGRVLVAQDITERKQTDERLRHLANHDALTGLPNRMLLTDRLSQAVARLPWQKRVLGVVFCDLDRFKVVNDTLGHNMGDELLREMSRRLRLCVREGDTVARIGGDEFVVILTDVARAEDIAPVARKIIDVASEPLYLDGHEVFVSASIGISVCPADGTDPESLLKKADIAMYRAKDSGKNCFQFYSSKMDARNVRRLSMDSALRHALEREEFMVYYQPLVDLKTGRIVSAEALVRWQHPELGIISPAEFLPLAEETGLIVPLGDWVLRTACIQAREWRATGHASFRVAINLSNRQYRQDDLLGAVARALHETGLHADGLEIELTEEIMMGQMEHSLAILRKFRDMNIELAIDDFGTGYSSLGHLRRFPIHTVKIDRSFITELPHDPGSMAIVEAIVAMAHTLKLKVVAEGVETEEQKAFLSSQGCDVMQGYLYSPPVPAQRWPELWERDSATACTDV